MKQRNIWTKSELQFIEDNWKKMSDEEISIALGNHTKGSVADKRKKMHLNRNKQKFFFEDVIKEFKKTDYILLSTEDEYVDTATNNIRYLCPHHIDKGEMTISLGHLKNGEGCYYCGREITESAHRLSEKENEEQCRALCEKQGFIFCGVEKRNKRYVIKYICSNHK